NHISSSTGGDWTSDLEPPEVAMISPFDGEPLDGPKQRLAWQISDSPAGVDWNSVEVTIGSIEYPATDPAVVVDGGIVVFDPKIAGISIADGDEVCLHISDVASECPNSADFCVLLSLDPANPEIASIFPANHTVVSCNPLEVATAIESEFGVNIENAFVRCEGITLTAANGLSLSGDTLFALFAESELAEGERNIEISGLADTLGNEIAAHNFSIVLDFTEPEVLDFWPGNGQIISPVGLTIGASVIDELAGVAPESLILTVDGQEFTVADAELSFSGDSVVLDAGGFNLAGNIELGLHIADMATVCGSNQNDYSWSIIVSGEGPVFELIEPFDGAITHLPYQAIKIRIFDTDGIDESSLELTVGNESWSIGEELELRGDTLFLSPETAYPSEQRLPVELSASDMLGNVSISGLGSFTTDFDPPEIIGSEPSDGAAMTEAPERTFIEFADDISGIDISSVRLSVDGVEFVSGDPFLQVWQEGLRLDNARANLVWSAPDTVTVILHSLADNAGDYGPANTISESYEFTFLIIEKGCTALPRPFSPNGDGFYDKVTIYTGEQLPARIKIYTTSGRPVREVTAENKWDWDGADDCGKQMPPGTYLYTVTRAGDNVTLCGGTIVLAR
ncbi:hypothetical protein DRQ36_10135, partial [bacterium]